MSITLIIVAAVSGLVFGLGVGFLAFRYYANSLKFNAQEEAKELIQEAQEKIENQVAEQKERIQEIEVEAWAKEEPSLLKTEEHIEELEERFTEKKQKADDRYSQERQKALEYESQVKKAELKIQEYQSQLDLVRKRVKELNDNFVNQLSSHLKVNKQDVVGEISQQLISETERKAANLIETTDEDAKEHSETLAKKILASVLDRFERPYCAERGIAPVYFETPEQRKILFDEKGENIALLQELTGCDLIIESDMDMIGVAGFDPVRRELARRVLERCLKERRPLNSEAIKKISANIRRELFGQIKRDGDKLAKELKLEGLHPEIRQMMGSLRYRYSFTQNQYFHCGEVGWLAGLLAGELKGTDITKARRSGMLHDLGKAMDHQIDGGHAVIGADFIKQRGEAPDVIHAVRAHHYDETPSSDLAYLVIAADAISGARPGARRSTIESYNQKVTELESIARSFEGVLDCYVLSGGRECRVITDGRKVDDSKALRLSAEIAKRIEQECNYPGQIKVVVVRETLAVETTRTG